MPNPSNLDDVRDQIDALIESSRQLQTSHPYAHVREALERIEHALVSEKNALMGSIPHPHIIERDGAYWHLAPVGCSWQHLTTSLRDLLATAIERGVTSIYLTSADRDALWTLRVQDKTLPDEVIHFIDTLLAEAVLQDAPSSRIGFTRIASEGHDWVARLNGRAHYREGNLDDLLDKLAEQVVMLYTDTLNVGRVTRRIRQEPDPERAKRLHAWLETSILACKHAAGCERYAIEAADAAGTIV